ncbi:protein glass-like [Stylophora pistillata]|uniref:protein glass-like n=1 Tax=Stylophora pistillata TaxID=50429 RepID=UPI000C0390EB|nr:protein glass-like [Stylophora pistillata]
MDSNEQAPASSREQEMPTSQMNLSIPSEFSLNEPLNFGSFPFEQQSRYTKMLPVSSVSRTTSSCYPNGPIGPIAAQNLEQEVPPYMEMMSSRSRSNHDILSNPYTPHGRGKSSEVVWCSSKMKIPRYVFHPNEALRPQHHLLNPNNSFQPEEPLNCNNIQMSDGPEEVEGSANMLRSDFRLSNSSEYSQLQEQTAMQWTGNYAALFLNQMAQSVNRNKAFNNNPFRYIPIENQGQESTNNDSLRVVPPQGHGQPLLATLNTSGAQATRGSSSNASLNGACHNFTLQCPNQACIFTQNATPSHAYTGATNFAPYPLSIQPSVPFSPILNAMGPVNSDEYSRERTNQEAISHTSFSTTNRCSFTPVGYALNHVPLLSFPRGPGYQASVSFSPRKIPLLQYPDPQAMFREANLLTLDQPNEDRVAPYTKTEGSIPKPSTTPGESLPQTDETPSEKEDTTASVSDKRSRQTRQCNICLKMCAGASSLKVHLRTHTGEKPFTCKVCQRTFAQAGGLKSHMRSHTGERPYKCDVCDKFFTHSTAVNNHKRTHTGEKPFVCGHKGCSKKFADRSTLTKHNRVHTGERPFECPHCKRKFTQLGNMNKHLRCKHIDKKK